MIHRFVLLILVIVPFLGGCAEPEAPPVTQPSPKATLDAMREALLARDYDAFYELNAPSERAEVEARWAEIRVDPARRAYVENLSALTGKPAAQVAEMSFREIFAARNARQMGDPAAEPMIRSIAFVEAKPAQNEPEDVVMVSHSVGEGEQKRVQEIPMRLEAGRYHIYSLLTAMLGD